MECFCQVENMASALGKQINTVIPASLVEFDRTEKAGTNEKAQEAVVKVNHQAIEYLALALKPMELLSLITRLVSKEWPESEAWKVTKDLQEIY